MEELVDEWLVFWGGEGQGRCGEGGWLDGMGGYGLGDVIRLVRSLESWLRCGGVRRGRLQSGWWAHGWLLDVSRHHGLRLVLRLLLVLLGGELLGLEGLRHLHVLTVGLRLLLQLLVLLRLRWLHLR